MNRKRVAALLLVVSCVGLGVFLAYLFYPHVRARMLLARWQRDVREQDDEEEIRVTADRTADALVELGPRAMGTVVQWAVDNPDDASPCFGYLLLISRQHQVPRRHWQLLVEDLLAKGSRVRPVIYLNYFASRADIPYILSLFDLVKDAEDRAGVLYLLAHLNCLEDGPSRDECLEFALRVARDASEEVSVRKAALGVLAFGWYWHHEGYAYRMKLLREFENDADDRIVQEAMLLTARLRALQKRTTDELEELRSKRR